jgi:SAM-dependent methyltransferase
VLEFTGERLIPGQVPPDLWNEHLARYLYALPLALGPIADLGCGSGYGSWLLSTAAPTHATDLDPDTIAYAQSRFRAPNLTFSAAPCHQTGLPASAFQLVTAFELIEHLPDPEPLLTEAARLLSPHGIFAVSTPNRTFYAESRANAGPNPFHHREYTVSEFLALLQPLFPHIHLSEQSHSSAQFLSGPQPLRAVVPTSQPESAHYLLALCSRQPFAPPPAYALFPRHANQLAAKQLHIQKLEAELALKQHWLDRETAAKLLLNQELDAALSNHRAQTAAYEQHLNRLQAELDQANLWAASQDQRITELESELTATVTRIRELDATLIENTTAYQEHLARLESENQSKTLWAQNQETRISELEADLLATLTRMRALDDTLAQRTSAYEAQIRILESENADKAEWALALQAELDNTQAQLQRTATALAQHRQSARAVLDALAASRWLRTGRRLGLGPDLTPWKQELSSE